MAETTYAIWTDIRTVGDMLRVQHIGLKLPNSCGIQTTSGSQWLVMQPSQVLQFNLGLTACVGDFLSEIG